jgi:hypothetical protein
LQPYVQNKCFYLVSVMSIVIDNITYNIEDEDLDEIEYLEILTMEEIIKDNPNFIAFSREEIFNELYDFFKNSNKADAIADLFFKDKAQNIQNIVFLTNAQKKTYPCEDENMQNLIDDINRLSKLQYEVAQKEKNKYHFALKYDDTDAMRLKPHMKTTVKLQDAYYPLYAEDETNIPVTGAYYKQRWSSTIDKLYHKIGERLKKPIEFNYADSDAYKNVDKLVKDIRPKMKTIIENLDMNDFEDEDLDYNDLNALLMRFDTSLDETNTADFEILRVHLEPILQEKAHEIKYAKYKIKELTVSNDKIEFFNQINKGFMQLLNIPEKMKEDYSILVQKLEEDRMNINAPPLLYNNMNDMIHAVINKDIELEDVIENIRANREVLIINHAMNTLKGLTTNDVESIAGMLEYMTDKFKSLQGAINPVFKFQFIDFYHDIKEVKEANDYSQYEGIPDVYKNDGNYEGMAVNDIVDDMDYAQDGGAAGVIGAAGVTGLDKYWLSIKYRDAIGFVEALQVVLPIIDAVSKEARLLMNHERLCDELFKHFSGISSKYDLMQIIMNKAGMPFTDDYVRDIVKISPAIALSNVESSVLMTNDIVEHVQNCNRQYSAILFDMLCIGLCWWSLQVQDEIINDTLIYDDNSLQVRYYNMWSVNGLPLKDSKQGVLVYISSIFVDILADTEYAFLTTGTNVQNKLMKMIQNEYKDVLDALREQSKNIESKRMLKGKQTFEVLKDTFKNKDKNSLLQNYINALIFYPSYKYKSLHKFLLGCCLQQVGKNFEPYNDIKARNDLQSAKNIFAKKLMTQNKQYALYVPQQIHKKNEKGDEESDVEDEANAFELPDVPDNIEINDDIVNTWLEGMIEVENRLLIEDHIYDLMKSTKPAMNWSQSYIKIFCKTAGVKSQDLENLLLQDDVNFKSIFLMLCKIWKQYPASTTEESNLLSSAISTVQDMMKHSKSLVKYVDEYNARDIQNIFTYIVCRAICLPCNVDLQKGNVLQASVNVSNGFISNLMKIVHASLMKHLRASIMPDEKTNADFINKIRENSKNKILQMMNMQTEDQRNITTALKKIGLKYQEEENEMNNYNINNEYNEFERDDDIIMQDQEDYDGDADDYGFIYS